MPQRCAFASSSDPPVPSRDDAPVSGGGSSSSSAPAWKPLNERKPLHVVPKGIPVDTTTWLDEQKESKFVEKRIEDHVKEGGQQGIGEEAASQLLIETSAVAAATGTSPVPAGPGPLRIKDPNAADPNVGKELVVQSRTTTGQVLWPATPEDIEILSKSSLLYPTPYEVEGSVIIRLVRLSDPVTSPVARTIRNRQFGIRGNEKYHLLAMGAVSAAIVWTLGFWQLQRMEWKRKLIELRRERLSMPRIKVLTSPFPWTDNIQDYVYRMVEVRGIYDHTKEMWVGPRPGSNELGESVPGYNIVTPLRLEDGNTILINRGHCSYDRLDPRARTEVPEWVRVIGVLEEGEIPNMIGRYARLKNRPDKNQYLYILAPDLAENASARNHRECSQALISAMHVVFEDDVQAGVKRPVLFNMRHKEDYLLFWADEHVHFNYAMQWFAMGTLFMGMTIYKFIEVSRWRF